MPAASHAFLSPNRIHPPPSIPLHLHSDPLSSNPKHYPFRRIPSSVPSTSPHLATCFLSLKTERFRRLEELKHYPFLRSPSHAVYGSPHGVRCSVSVATEASPAREETKTRPSPAEVSRTIMELSSTGTLSTMSHDGWPLSIGAQFVIDAQGVPALCLKEPERLFNLDGRSSFHVRFEQSGSRALQCTILGILTKPDDTLLLKKLCAAWEKKFGEEVDEQLLYLISVERVLQIEDLKEDSVWVNPSEYVIANPDPLRNFAESIVDEMNSGHAEDVHRLCRIYVDPGFQVTGTKMIWVDRLGFDLHIYSEQGVFVARIPFPREVTDEKGVKSSFNSMSHLAWEIEKNYVVADFDKVKCLKKIR